MPSRDDSPHSGPTNDKSDNDETFGSVASVWDNCAESYDVERRHDPVYCSCTATLVNEIPQGTPLCLDAGCGTGLSTAALHSRCQNIVALDFSQESLNILQQKGLPNVVTRHGNLRSLPFNDSVFDAAICANALQHLKAGEAQSQAIHELRRVTKKNGIICVSVHHYSRAKRKAGWIKEGQPGQAGIDHIFRFTLEELQRHMPRAKIKGVGYYELLRLPGLGGVLQDPVAAIFGRLAARAGYGHMLIATEINRK